MEDLAKFFIGLACLFLLIFGVVLVLDGHVSPAHQLITGAGLTSAGAAVWLCRREIQTGRRLRYLAAAGLWCVTGVILLVTGTRDMLAIMH